MAIQRWLLPEGIEEVLPPRAAAMEHMRRRILDLFDSWGYELVIPPFIEYLDSLLVGTGQDLDLQTFKLIDQLSGRLLGVRADMTPQVARIDSHRLDSDRPVRLCYLGTVLHTLPDGRSGTRSPVQVGAEIYGHGGIESDCEILWLMLECLNAAGIRDVHVDLGHVGIFRGLARRAGLGAEVEAALYAALQRKARPELESLLAEARLEDEDAQMLLSLVELNGDRAAIEEARRALRNAPDDVRREIETLDQISTAIEVRCSDVQIHFDLAELRGYRYHTGLVFAAFIPGRGREIARGGRYDEIGEAYGHARPATGFSTALGTLIEYGDAAVTPATGVGILAPWCADPALARAIGTLRERGERVIHELPAAGRHDRFADSSRDCDRVIVHRAGDWVVETLS